MFVSQYIADQLHIPLGNYYHTASSLHSYLSFSEKVKSVVNFPYTQILNYSGVPTFGNLPVSDFRDQCNEVYEEGRVNVVSTKSDKLRDYSLALYSENALLSQDKGAYVSLVRGITDPNLQLSLLDVGQRRLHCSLWDHELFKSCKYYTCLYKTLNQLDQYRIQLENK
jgi:hypothetical protein